MLRQYVGLHQNENKNTTPSVQCKNTTPSVQCKNTTPSVQCKNQISKIVERGKIDTPINGHSLLCLGTGISINSFKVRNRINETNVN